MISKETVKHIAKLARIALSEDELEKMQKELAKILEYIEQLKELDLKDLEPQIFSSPVKNVFREDLPDPFNEPKKLIEGAPNKEDGFIKIKSVFKNGDH